MIVGVDSTAYAVHTEGEDFPLRLFRAWFELFLFYCNYD